MTGCYSLSSKDKICLEKPELIVQSAEVVRLDPVKFVIVTKNNKNSIIDDNTVFFSLRAQDYKNLSTNIEKIKNYMILQNQILSQYKNYYTPKK